MKKLSAFLQRIMHPVCLRAKQERKWYGQMIHNIGCFGMTLHAAGLVGVLQVDHNLINALGATGAALAGIAIYFLEGP